MTQSAEATGDRPDIGAILKKITDVMVSLDDSQSVLDALVRLVTEILRVDRCSLMLIDPETRELRIRAAHGVKPEVIRSYRGRMGEGIAGWVAMEGKPLLITDIESHPLFRRNSRRGYTTTSLLSVPLRFRDKVIGVLNVNNKKDGTKLSKLDELWLSTVANFIVISLEKARMREVEVEKERIDADLHLAIEIQKSFLPRELPSGNGFQYAALCKSAYQVAGDFYDVIPLANGVTCLVMGDVCGKGIAAALYMARVISYFRAVANLKGSAEGLFDGVNRFLAAEWHDRSLVTACMLVVHRQKSMLQVYNAGHMPPYHYSERTGTLRTIEFDHGFPLSVEPGSHYMSIDVLLEPGDCVVMFTDGITEAVNERGEPFGFEALERVIGAHSGPPGKLVEAIDGAVSAFVGDRRQSDDKTVFVVRRAAT